MPICFVFRKLFIRKQNLDGKTKLNQLYYTPLINSHEQTNNLPRAWSECSKRFGVDRRNEENEPKCRQFIRFQNHLILPASIVIRLSIECWCKPVRSSTRAKIPSHTRAKFNPRLEVKWDNTILPIRCKMYHVNVSIWHHVFKKIQLFGLHNQNLKFNYFIPLWKE